MDEGFILSNKFRRAVFNELASGETNIQRIAKKHRIIQTIAQRVVDDFIKGGIVEKKNNNYYFTKEGEKLLESIGK
jgi:predicted transcriptional regulator